MKKSATALMAGVAGALGAASMYIFDPDRGARRRARLGKQVEHGRRMLVDAAGSTAHNLRSRTDDYRGALRSTFSHGTGARNHAVGERVRAALGGAGAAIGSATSRMTQRKRAHESRMAQRTHAHDRRSPMKRIFAVLAGTGAGAAALYYFDPERGPRRRAMLRDQFAHSQNRLQDAAGATSRDVRNRAGGYRASVRSAFMRASGASDEVVGERARAAIGRAVTHPGSIEVSVNNGVATLSGPVLAREVPLLIDRVLDVRGVRDVVNRLDVHQEPGNIPGLQGGSGMEGGARPEYMQRNWSPAARLAAGAAGTGMATMIFRRGLFNKLIGLGGVALVTRAATNKEMRELTGMGARRRAITVQKTIHINAPVERVFELWSRCENYPQFMSHVREVRPIGGAGRNQRWHWTVQGTSGMEFEFDSTTTGYEENRFIAWRSEPGAWVQHSGQARFQSNPDRSTTVSVTLSYNPVAGAAGHVIAKLLGDDPKRQLDDDLMRMKSYLETGVRPHDAAAATTGTTTHPGM